MKKKKTDLGLLFKTMGAYKITLVISVIFAALSAVVNIYAYTYIYKAADEIVSHLTDMSGLDNELLKNCGKNVMFCICGAFGLHGFALLFSHITAFNTAAKLKNKVIKHIGTLPAGFFDTNTSGGLRKLIEKNTDLPETLIAHQIPYTTQSVVLPIAFAVFMFRYSVAMSLASIVPVIIGFILLMSIMAGAGGDFVKKYQQANADISNAAVEYVRGIPVMKTFGQTADSFKRYKDATVTFTDYVTKFAMSMMTADSSYNTAINSIFFTLLPTAVLLFDKKRSGSVIVSFVFFVSLIPMAVTMLKRIMSNSSETIIVSEAMERLGELLAEKPMIYSGSAVPKTSDICFENVFFRYNENTPNAVDGISLKFPEGKVTALVGMSGGGKSTIASLAARMYDCTEGSITIGGVSIKDIPKAVLNDMISVVFQESTLLKTTLAENISLYRPDASKEDILAALEAAQCGDILKRLPDGIQTVYGSQGTYFSGGEIQRLAIARAILKDAPIVILDEATAFADSENEYLIRKALKKLLKGKTVIMIAHRMSTVTDADNICVIEKGRIAEQGTHDELMSLGGRYAQMVNEYNSAVSWKIGGEEVC
ncbi:MAG: ABC transporter ATP-binding protein [Ruminococcus sp.]|nr:ABC transporter ATP-binding protein [Ruminococcus sp.]